jgi:hypothetical protein
MTIRNFSEHETGERADVGVWFCEACERFHIKAGNVLLTFDREEFSEFTNSVYDCFTANALFGELAFIN